jgi:hypothetical protein
MSMSMSSLFWILIALVVGRRASAQEVDVKHKSHNRCQDLYNEAVSRWEEKACTRMSYTKTVGVQKDFTAFDAFEPDWDCSVQDRVGTPYTGDGKHDLFCWQLLLL